MPDHYVDLCHIDDLADGESLGLDPLGQGRDSLFVVKCGGRPYVYRNVCPHQGSTLPWRKNRFLNGDGSRIVCHAHGAEFDIASGRCTLGAALGLSLTRIPVEMTPVGVIRAQRASVVQADRIGD